MEMNTGHIGKRKAESNARGVKRKKMSFKLKMLITMLVIFAASFTLISGIHYNLLDSAVKSLIEANLNLYTDSIMAQVWHLNIGFAAAKASLNSNHLAIARTVAQLLDDAPPEELTTEELQRIAELLGILELNIVDSDGILIYSNVPEFIGYDYKSSPITEMYMGLCDGTLTEIGEEPRRSVLDAEESGATNHYSAVPRENGGFLQIGFSAGYFGALEEILNMQRIIEQETIGANGFGMVIIDRYVVAYPDAELRGQDVTAEDWYKTISAGDGFGWITLNGQTYYAQYKNAMGSIVVGLLPEQDYNQERNRFAAESTKLLLLTSTIMVIFVSVILNGLLSPVKYMVSVIKVIARGNLDARIEGSYGSEFNTIRDAVNVMAADLKVYMRGKLQAEAEKAALERLAQMKATFLANISHEVRTPLAVLASYAGMVSLEAQKSGLDEQTAADLEKVGHEAKRVSNLIEALEKFPVQDSRAAVRDSLNIGELILQTVHLFRHMLEREGVRLVTDIPDDLPPVFGSAEELTQVIFNLLQNARIHTDRGSVLVAVKSEKGFISTAIADTGAGIAPGLLPHVFERGVYGEKGGSGIGLALCKEIIEAHGGTIRIGSEFGRGTVALFTLPVYTEGTEDGE